MLFSLLKVLYTMMIPIWCMHEASWDNNSHYIQYMVYDGCMAELEDSEKVATLSYEFMAIFSR